MSILLFRFYNFFRSLYRSIRRCWFSERGCAGRSCSYKNSTKKWSQNTNHCSRSFSKLWLEENRPIMQKGEHREESKIESFMWNYNKFVIVVVGVRMQRHRYWTSGIWRGLATSGRSARKHLPIPDENGIGQAGSAENSRFLSENFDFHHFRIFIMWINTLFRYKEKIKSIIGWINKWIS